MSSSIFERMEKANGVQSSGGSDKRRRVDFDTGPDRFYRQAMELYKALVGSSPREPSGPFRNIWNVSVTDIQGSMNICPSDIFQHKCSW